jgi:tRNA(Arg) A34 adenosine deaminase TadA
MPSKRIVEFAINGCKKSLCEHKIAAVLYKGGSVIRIACNNKKTIQYRKKYFAHGTPSRHAELNVIHSIPKDVLSQCSMLVIRVDNKGALQSAKPCEACAWSIYNSGMKKVFYSSYSGEIIKLNFDELINGKYTKEYFGDYQR